MSSRQTADEYEFALVIRHLVRLRHHQGPSAVAKAVLEATGLEWQFCVNCGTEEPHKGDLCTGCGRNANRGLGHERKACAITRSE